MIRLVLLQLRSLILWSAGLSMLLILVLVVHGLSAGELVQELTKPDCRSASLTCSELATDLKARLNQIVPYLGYLVFLPVCVAGFWGAPLLSRELESGTAALAWTQSITRTGWLTIRFAVATVVVGMLSLAVGFTVTWWFGMFSVALGEPDLPAIGHFDNQGLLFFAQCICGLAIGTTIGAAIRRVVPAMATSMAALLALMIVATVATSFVHFDSVRVVILRHAAMSLAFLCIGAIATYLLFNRVNRLQA